MISKRFGTSKKASKISKRVLGMESLENRELLSINPLGYDGSEVVQTAATSSTESAEFGTESIDFSTEAVTGSTNATTSYTGLTTNAVTINWTKPTTYTAESVTTDVKSITSYELVVKKGTDVVAEVDATTLKTKTTWSLTGLTTATSETEYTYVITAKLTLKNEGSEVVEEAEVATGSFKTLGTDTAATVPVGPATDVKAAFTAKTNTVKVTWKAPANYTGGYTVTLTQKADGTGDSVTYTVDPGAKLEASLKIGDAEIKGEDGTLAKDKIYYVVVEANATNSIASSTTNVTTGTITAVNAPTLACTAKTGVSGGTTVTITPGTATDNAVVGYWVGLYATEKAATAAKIGNANLRYVEGTTIDFTGATAGQVAVAIAVAADGTASTAALSAALTPTEITTADTKTIAAKDVKATPKGSSTPYDYTVTWTDNLTDSTLPATPDKLGLVKYTISAWHVKYSSDGGKTWMYAGTTAMAVTTLDIEGLDPGKSYTVAVEAVFTSQKSVADGVDENDAPKFKWDDATPAAMAKAATVTVKSAAVKIEPAVKMDNAADAVPADDNTGTTAKVNWKAVSGTKYKVVVTDANKAVIHSETVTADSATGSVNLTDLTPGAKYNVEVYAIGTVVPGVSSALKIAVTATAFPASTAKVSEIGLLGATVTVTTPKDPASGLSYYMEITDVVDAKGKPDWNAGWWEAITDVSKAQEIKAQLEPSTQYFVRIVTTDKPVKGEDNDDWSDVTKVATGKEVKFKTVAAPLATVSKSGFAMNGANFGFKFEIKSPDLNDSKGLLLMGEDKDVATTYKFDILVAGDTAKADKVTGALSNVITVATGLTLSDDFEKVENKGKTTGYKLKDAILLSALSGDGKLGNLESLKSLQIQLLVTYTNTEATTQEFATLYTKAAKLALPKWFV